MEITLVKGCLLLFALVAVILGVYDVKQNKGLTKTAAFQIIIAFFVFVFGIIDSSQNAHKQKSLLDTIATLHSKIDSLRDTLVKVNQSLERNLGVKIDNKTGQILILDSQILKAVLKIQPATLSIPDSENYNITRRGNLLSISPKEGAWGNLFIYADTTYSDDGMALNFTPPGGSFGGVVKTIRVVNKNVVVNQFRGFDPVSLKHPQTMDLSRHPHQFIIFGEASSLTKIYYYKDGLVKWIPE